MPPSDPWHKIDRLFARALDRPPDERAAFLNEACDDETVRHAVEDLLAASERDALLDKPLAERSGAFWEGFATDVAPAPSFEGQRAGPYRLMHEIGRGGMGVVYLAERADGHFEQRVAVKLLRRESFAEDLARRFAQERQILASLQHPNIARLYDGGVTEDGLPYLAMEHVEEGRPLDAYCEAEGCSFEERLRLFLTVVRAVQHAHQHLIIHRDLKPSNILVTPGGEPKLLDFGLAKLLEESAEGTLAAYPTQRWMTLQYASPEQVRGEALTTASDTYQLGLILYELLTEQRPYDVEGRTPSEAERVICETEPARPSTAVAAEASEAHFAHSARLRKKLKGDLDTIILKALRKDPARGYASAETLADDLERYLEGRPISARPDTLGYRMGKFVQRHRIGVAAAALVFLSLVAGIAGTAWQAQRAADEARRAEAERDKAEQVTNFLVDVFEVADPGEARGDTVTARELLARGAARIRSELMGQPEVQASMMTALGRVHRQLGLYDEALPLLEDALETRQNHLRPPHPDLAESLYELGVLHQQQGDHERADALLTEALGIRERLFEAPHPALAAALYQLGLTARARSDYDRAEDLLRQSLSMHQALYGNAHQRVPSSQFELAMTLHDQGHYEKAFALLQEAVATYRSLPGETTPAYAASLHALAGFYDAQRSHAVAESLHREALTVRRALHGPEHPQVAASLRALGAVLAAQGRFEAAEQHVRDALTIQRAWHEGGHPDLAFSLVTLGRVLWSKGEPGAAEAALREGLAMQRHLFDEATPLVGTTLRTLADRLQEAGRLDEAGPLYEEALSIYRRAYGEDNLFVLSIQFSQAMLLRRRGNYEQALPILEEALEQYQALFSSEDHPRLADARRELGACLTALGRHDEAEQHLLRSYAAYKKADNLKPRQRAALEHLVALYDAWGRPAQAAEYRTLLAAAPAP